MRAGQAESRREQVQLEAEKVEQEGLATEEALAQSTSGAIQKEKLEAEAREAQDRQTGPNHSR